jgi:signal transduction histidine kinase
MFLATLGHELRNPLSVLFQLHAARGARDAEPKLHPMISGQIEHLKRLVDDLLDVARITRGTLQLQKRPTDLTAIVRAAAQAVATSVGERQARSRPLGRWVAARPGRRGAAPAGWW